MNREPLNELLDYAQNRKDELTARHDQMNANYWRGYIACLSAVFELLDGDEDEAAPW